MAANHAHNADTERIVTDDDNGRELATCTICGARVHRPLAPGQARNRNPWTTQNEPLVHSGAFMRRPSLPDEDIPLLVSLYGKGDESERTALLSALYNAYLHDGFLHFMEVVTATPERR